MTGLVGLVGLEYNHDRQLTNGPQLPAALVTTQGSGQHNDGVDGVKNYWVPAGCQWKLKICTYNARSLSSDDRLHEFEDEL